MERDIDLIRQLLLDVEREGVATPVNHLRREISRDDDQRILYHVRLLIDVGFLKEAGQTSAGAPCVRLTHEGSEFVELTRNEPLWREAKAAVRAATGGVPITVLKSLLVKWAWRSVVGISAAEPRDFNVRPIAMSMHGGRSPRSVARRRYDTHRFRLGRRSSANRSPAQRPVVNRRFPPAGRPISTTAWQSNFAERPTSRPLPDHLI